MKQQLNPAVAIAAILGAIVVIGLVVFFLNNRPAPAAPTGKSPADQAPVRNMSPDEIVKQHKQQMPEGGSQ